MAASFCSFTHLLDYASGKEIDLVCEDGVVALSRFEKKENYTEAELQSARQYAEWHLKRTGYPFVRCEF